MALASAQFVILFRNVLRVRRWQENGMSEQSPESETRFRLVGISSDGRRVTLFSRMTLDFANRVGETVTKGGTFASVWIESESNDGATDEPCP